MPKTNTYDRQHRANVAYYQRLIDAIFEAATKEAAAIGSRVDFDPSRVFSFDDYPITQDLVKKLLSRLGSGMEAAIVDGVRSEWTLANNKNDELARRVFGDNIGRLTQEQYRRYFSNNDKAREAFLNRKEQGLNLSERVWRYADQFKSDIELGLDIGIRSGLDAPAMARELQQFLQHPDMLFRRVRDEHGMLQLSKRASEFHPGQGVYRSSYKNARRLAATETNMAYMSADHERWQQLDFVVGIEIRLSGNHTCLGRDGKPHPFHDICDELQGRYPKDFKFTGWHPHCRCIAISILKTEKELMEENRAILRGEEPSQESENTVTDVPDNFKKWVEENGERVGRAKTLPYFIQDNRQYVDLGKYGYNGDRLGRKATAQARMSLAEHEEIHQYSEQQIENFKEITRQTGYERGEPMTFEEADNGASNEFHDSDNCAACVLVHELRLRGYDITALAYDKKQGSVSAILSADTRSAWITAKGKTPEFTAEIGGTKKEILAKIERQTQTVGSRYHLGWDNPYGGGHIVTLERTKDGLVCYDPQKDDFYSLESVIDEMLEGSKLQLLRVDRLLVRPDFVRSLTTVAGGH